MEKIKARQLEKETPAEREKRVAEEKEKEEKEKAVREAKEREENERKEREKREAEREKAKEREREKLKGKGEKPDKEKEKQERERLEKERLEKERLEKERLEKEKQEAKKKELEEQEKAKAGVEEPTKEADAKKDGKRRLPTKNPVRARQEREVQEKEAAKQREEAAKAEKEAAKAAGISLPEPPKNLSASSSSSSARSTQLGGFGLLYALGADQYLFQRKDNLKKQTDQSNVQPKDLPRLIHVKGRRNCFVRQVELTYTSLNKGDTFVLDCGKGLNTLYQWNGSEANRIEKGKAMDIAKSIKDKERVGARVIIVDEGKETDDFWKAIGGKGPVAPAASAGDDKEAEQAIRQYIHLYKVVKKPDATLDLVVVAEGRLLKNMIEQSDCYILDCVSEMYVWTGQNSDIKLRNASMKLAAEMMEGREFWTAPVSRELPGSEQILFKERFADWGGSLPITVQQIASGKNTAQARAQEKIDIAKMHSPKPEKEEVMVDDGQGKVTIWRVEEFTKVEVPAEKHGQFFSGDSYLILYSYVFKNKDCYLIYFWQGRNSTTNEKGTSALLTIEQNDMLKGQAKEIRVVQNKEPKHFLSIFKGKIVIHNGKDPETKKGSSFKRDDVALYHVQGTTEVNTRAIQISLNASSLNSASAFILKARNKIFAWYGTHSNNIERNFAKNVFAYEGHTVVEQSEGSESADWWTLIGGKETYPTYNLSTRREARLFVCSSASGAFIVEEIAPFVQDDLLNDDVMILDAYSAVYVWIGPQSTETERKSAMETVCEYVQFAPDSRPKDSPIWLLRSGEEPYVFTTHFHGWDYTKRKVPVTFNGGLSSVRDALAQYNRKYTYQELVDKKYPKGIDTSKLEEYLNDDEFVTVFEMTAEEFSKQPLWKRQNVKRELGLY